MNYGRKYLNYQLNRGWFRKVVRNFYLENILRKTEGKVIDFGCGVGDLLRKLPAGSIGLEINKSTVNLCRKNGLNVSLYNFEKDNYQLKDIRKGKYKTIVISHVLEHLSNPDEVLKKIAISAYRLKINTILIVLPGWIGFLSDKTHQTYIDEKYLEINNLIKIKKFLLKEKSHFPINNNWFGRYFIHNEMILVYKNND